LPIFTMTIRALIVDDEHLGRRMLKTLLHRHGDVDLVGTCSGGRAAIQAIRRHAPDLVLLDVEMPEVDGFDVLDALRPEERPLVIFVTAYDHYAVQAFEAHALDYVTKPVDDERLATSLDRVRQRRREQSAAAQQDAVDDLLTSVGRSGRDGPTRLVVDAREGKRLLPTSAVDYVTAAGDYVEVHTGEASYLRSSSLSALADRLDSSQFARVHRSTIVNLDRVEVLRPLRSGDYVLVLADGTELRMSRTYREAVAERLEGTL
jgi:two-component system LytT family response regulator